MFFIIKARNFLIFVAVVGIFSAALIAASYKTEYVATTPPPKYSVVIDAGHGGIDGGSVGTQTNIKESDLNLAYAITLSKQLKQAGIETIMTRSTKDGLYNTKDKNLKKSDMQKRKQIIDQTNPACVISIHMNSFALKSCKGAQVFYKQNNTEGKNLADCIQQQFITTLPNAKQTTSSGDYFIVNCTNLPAVIVECGFVSNPEEEKLLQTEDYKQKVCYLIMCGVLNYFNLPTQ